MPALVMVGKFDGAVGVEQMRALAEHLPHAQFDEFESQWPFRVRRRAVKIRSGRHSLP